MFSLFKKDEERTNQGVAWAAALVIGHLLGNKMDEEMITDAKQILSAKISSSTKKNRWFVSEIATGLRYCGHWEETGAILLSLLDDSNEDVRMAAGQSLSYLSKRDK